MPVSGKMKFKASTRGTLHKDMFFTRPVSISFDTAEYDRSADIKVQVIIEPSAVIGESRMKSFINDSSNFDIILAWNQEVLDKCDNSYFFPFGSTWIDESDRKIFGKKKIVSLLASHKTIAEGHKLRHSFIEKVEDGIVDFYGTSVNNNVDNKITALKDYMFSIVIENTSDRNWFTEKIIDCMVTGTIPIFWGCENIGDFFNKNGIIDVKNEEELLNIVAALDQGMYELRRSAIKDNFYNALRYCDFYDRLEKVIRQNIRDLA